MYPHVNRNDIKLTNFDTTFVKVGIAIREEDLMCNVNAMIEWRMNMSNSAYV